MARSAGISKLVDEKAISFLKPCKVNFTLISFSHCLNSLILFITVAPSGIKNEPNNKFDNIGSQKVDNYVLAKVPFLSETLAILLN